MFKPAGTKIRGAETDSFPSIDYWSLRLSLHDRMTRLFMPYGSLLIYAFVSSRRLNAIYFGDGCISLTIPLRLLFVYFREQLHQRRRQFSYDGA